MEEKDSDFVDFYELLGVPVEATSEEIHAAWLKEMQIYYPDRHRGEPNYEEFVEFTKALNEAHATLMDGERRAKYDAEWRERVANSESSENSERSEKSADPKQKSRSHKIAEFFFARRAMSAGDNYFLFAGTLLISLAIVVAFPWREIFSAFPPIACALAPILLILCALEQKFCREFLKPFIVAGTLILLLFSLWNLIIPLQNSEIPFPTIVIGASVLATLWSLLGGTKLPFVVQLIFRVQGVLAAVSCFALGEQFFAFSREREWSHASLFSVLLLAIIFLAALLAPAPEADGNS